MALTKYWLSGATPNLTTAGIGAYGRRGSEASDGEEAYASHYRISIGATVVGTWVLPDDIHTRIIQNFTTASALTGAVKVELLDSGKLKYSITTPQSVTIAAGTHTSRLTFWNYYDEENMGHTCGIEWGTGKSDADGDFQFVELTGSNFTVTYNANGGTGTPPATQSGAITYTVSEYGTLTKAGVNAVGWNTKPDGTGYTYFAGDVIVPSADTTLYALYSITNATSVTVTPRDITLTTIGQQAQLTATVLPANAVNKSVTWASDNTAVATVDWTGLVTCVSVGSAKITATTQDGGFVANAFIEPFAMTPLAPTRSTLPYMDVNLGDTLVAGETIFGNSTNVSNLYDYWSSDWGDKYPKYYQTDDGIAHVVNGVDTSTSGAISTWLAFDKYKDFSVEVEFRTTAKPNASMDVGLVTYPSEFSYSHLPKPRTFPTTYLGYVYKHLTQIHASSPVTIPWDTLLGQWIKLRVSYRVDGSSAYVTGSVLAGNTTYTAPELSLGAIAQFPNPVIAPTTWSTTGRVMWRNLKILTGALSAYSLDFTRLSGGVAVNSTLANGGSWTYRAGTGDYANGNLVLNPRQDAQGWVNGTGTLTLPKINIPPSSSFGYIEFNTTENTNGNIAWALKDANGVVKQSGTSANGYNKVSITATDITLQPEFTFTGTGTAKLHFVDISWMPPRVLTYNANGGTGTIANQTGTTITLASSGFTKEGYNLAGWNTQADGSGTSYALGQTASFEADTTLYAIWTLEPKDVTAQSHISTSTNALIERPAQAKAMTAHTVLSSTTNAVFTRVGALVELAVNSASSVFSGASLIRLSALNHLVAQKAITAHSTAVLDRIQKAISEHALTAQSTVVITTEAVLGKVIEVVAQKALRTHTFADIALRVLAWRTMRTSRVVWGADTQVETIWNSPKRIEVKDCAEIQKDNS